MHSCQVDYRWAKEQRASSPSEAILFPDQLTANRHVSVRLDELAMHRSVHNFVIMAQQEVDLAINKRLTNSNWRLPIRR